MKGQLSLSVVKEGYQVIIIRVSCAQHQKPLFCLAEIHNVLVHDVKLVVEKGHKLKSVLTTFC